ncbi:MAG: hypothetical protein GY724_07475 [Actinomycetia bacterium]|nr:hypothetical protein [Actinomycetes bacterium]
MAPDIRPYERQRDLEAVDRIWREVGWLEPDNDIESLDWILTGSNVEVGMLDDEAECAVSWAPGSIRYQNTDLGLCAVTAVTTSRIGRKQGFATTMTARAIRNGAEAGAAVAALGIFDQGFYDRLGFGTGVYEQLMSIDPSALTLDHVPYRRPVRLGPDDHGEMFQALANRHRLHGGVVLDAPAAIRAETAWVSNSFGLGYRSDDGRLTHFVFGKALGENGPYRVHYIAYEQPHQLLELLRLLKELGDQVTTVKLFEPPHIQLQDLLLTPFRRQTQTVDSVHANAIRSVAWMQLRILDLGACVSARAWVGPEVRFNLSLTDPAPALLGDDDDGWAGVGGDYTVTIGAMSSVETGLDPSLETLRASVNAFSRAWFGVRSASSLALTDDLSAAPKLLTNLDEALTLPPPKPGWDF